MEWNLVVVELGELKPWNRNPKRIGKAQADRLLAFWEKAGQFQTIAIGPDGEVYDGHQRLSVLLKKYGKKYKVKALKASRSLTEPEREEFVIAAHVGTNGQFDWDVLSGWNSSDLEMWGLDDELLQNWRSDTNALRLLIEAEEPFAPVPDETPQLDEAHAVTCPFCNAQFVPK